MVLTVGGQWEGSAGRAVTLRHRQPPPGMQLALSSVALPSRGQLFVARLMSHPLAHPGALLVSTVPGLSLAAPAGLSSSASAVPAFLFAFRFAQSYSSL